MTGKNIVLSSIAVLVLGGCLVILFLMFTQPLRLPVGSTNVLEYIRTLDKFSFSRLAQRTYTQSKITREKVLYTKPAFTAYLFSFVSDGKKVTGQLNIPKSAVLGNTPVIVMVRGFVDKEIYYTGLGSRPAGEAFAQAGYITIAPDFLGYGGSDGESLDIWEARFEKPITMLNLLASLPSLPEANTAKVGIWGHSNGGQIALSVLEISKKPYPTTLWAPVTEKFPDSILQFIDELPNQGAYIKSKLAEFHERYLDADYSVDAHIQGIAADVQLHQGTKDEEVPVKWSHDFVEAMKAAGKKITYFEYSGEDHNFRQGQSATLIQRDLSFFDQRLR